MPLVPRAVPALLDPSNCVLVLADSQPQMIFGVGSQDAQTLLNNTAGLARAAAAYDHQLGRGAELVRRRAPSRKQRAARGPGSRLEPAARTGATGVQRCATGTTRRAGYASARRTITQHQSAGGPG